MRATTSGEGSARRQTTIVEDPMKGFIGNIADRTAENRDFRHVAFTGPYLQLVLMTLRPGEDIGDEIHHDTDQFFRVEEGKGEVWIDGTGTPINEAMAIVIPAGARHNIVNTGDTPMKMYTIYAPPHHADGTVHHTKADATVAAGAE
jgi:mannose-6-phosphate isomerase-like protein (cupin superfamily)